jgi:ATP-dependent Lon protease
MFPLSSVVFPHQRIPLHVFEPRYVQLLQDVGDGEGRFGICLIARGNEVGGGDERHNVGTLVVLDSVTPLADGTFIVVATGVERIVIDEWLEDNPYPRARVHLHPGRDVPTDSQLLSSAEQAVRSLRVLHSEMDPDYSVAVDSEMSEAMCVRSWQLCSMTPMATLDQLKLLREDECDERLRQLAEICCERYGDLQRLLSQAPMSWGDLGDAE